MKNSSARKRRLKKRKRLSVERLESRTVLSATNLLATAMDVRPDFEDRFDIGSRHAVIAEQSHTRGPALHRDLSRREGHRPARSNGDSKSSHRESRSDISPQHKVGSFSTHQANASLGLGSHVRAGSFERPRPSRGTSPSRDPSLMQPPSQPVVAGTLEVRMQFRVNQPVPLTVVIEDSPWAAAERLAGSGLPTLQEAAERFDQTTVLTTIEQAQPLTARPTEHGVVGTPPTADTNLDRFFELPSGQSRGEFLSGEPARPRQLLPLRPANIGSTVEVGADLVTGVSSAVDLANYEALSDAGGMIELPAQLLDNSDTIHTSDQQALVSQDQLRTSSRQPIGDSERLAFRDHDWLAGAAGDLTDSLAELLLTNRLQPTGDIWSELGMAPADESMTERGGRDEVLPEDDAWWHDPYQRTRDSFWLDFSEDVESDLANDAQQLADGPAAATQVADTDEEGGMIELMAIASRGVNAGPADSASQESVAGRDSAMDSNEEVQMDTAVAMFQAFELAAIPQPAEAEQPGSVDDDPTKTTAADAGETVPGDQPETHELSEEKTQETQPVALSDESEPTRIHAASLPALLASAFLFLERALPFRSSPRSLRADIASRKRRYIGARQ